MSRCVPHAKKAPPWLKTQPAAIIAASARRARAWGPVAIARHLCPFVGSTMAGEGTARRAARRPSSAPPVDLAIPRGREARPPLHPGLAQGRVLEREPERGVQLEQPPVERAAPRP